MIEKNKGEAVRDLYHFEWDESVYCFGLIDWVAGLKAEWVLGPTDPLFPENHFLPLRGLKIQKGETYHINCPEMLSQI